MNTKQTLVLHLKCTTCKKTLPATEAQIEEARDMGCYFSSCCQAVATVERADLRQRKQTRSHDRKAYL